MVRRVRLPGADELFRSTAPGRARQGAAAHLRPVPQTGEPPPDDPAPPLVAEVGERAARTPPTGGATTPIPTRRRLARRPSGRERHDEKITVYVSSEELMDLEHARLILRGEHGLAVDRGRLVREAVALVLADLETHGGDSALVRRLFGSGY